jgi:hypothetical protein
MFNPKTHFEQVPLEVVRKIVEEQILKEAATELHQGIKEETLNMALPEAEGQPITLLLKLAQVESLN